jgi:hypothetical protein
MGVLEEHVRLHVRNPYTIKEPNIGAGQEHAHYLLGRVVDTHIEFPLGQSETGMWIAIRQRKDELSATFGLLSYAHTYIDEARHYVLHGERASQFCVVVHAEVPGHQDVCFLLVEDLTGNGQRQLIHGGRGQKAGYFADDPTTPVYVDLGDANFDLPPDPKTASRDEVRRFFELHPYIRQENRINLKL